MTIIFRGNQFSPSPNQYSCQQLYIVFSFIILMLKIKESCIFIAKRSLPTVQRLSSSIFPCSSVTWVRSDMCCCIFISNIIISSIFNVRIRISNFSISTRIILILSITLSTSIGIMYIGVNAQISKTTGPAWCLNWKTSLSETIVVVVYLLWTILSETTPSVTFSRSPFLVVTFFTLLLDYLTNSQLGFLWQSSLYFIILSQMEIFWADEKWNLPKNPNISNFVESLGKSQLQVERPHITVDGDHWEQIRLSQLAQHSDHSANWSSAGLISWRYTN